MLMHCLLLFELKFNLNSFVCAFSKMQNPSFIFFILSSPSGPVSRQAQLARVRSRSPNFQAWFTCVARRRPALPFPHHNPAQQLGPVGPTATASPSPLSPAPTAADRWGPRVIPLLPTVPEPDSSPSPGRVRPAHAFPGMARTPRPSPWPI
jgi:hypothetical protein